MRINKTRPAFLEQPESRRLEFKEAFPKGDQVARTAVAFANGAGGKIIFGVKDSPRQIIGIPDDQLFKTEERITNCIFDLCAPSIVPEIYIQSIEDKSLLIKDYKLIKAGSGQGEAIEAESLQEKVATALSDGPLSKSEIANKIGLKNITGHLNRTIRSMLIEGLIEYTIPEKPNSRLQKYRLKKQD